MRVLIIAGEVSAPSSPTNQSVPRHPVSSFISVNPAQNQICTGSTVNFVFGSTGFTRVLLWVAGEPGVKILMVAQTISL